MRLKRNNSLLLLVVVVALLLFSVMFVVQQVGAFDFWWWMSTNLLLIISLSLILFRGHGRQLLSDLSDRLPNKLMLGIGSALALYLIFLLGDFLSQIIIPGAEGEIAGIYEFKGEASPFRILILMLLVIGPGEEIFWRGILQHRLMERLGPAVGFIVSTLLYTSVHILTGNFMLIMAALTAGIFWGWMYMRYRSITANVVSHVVWDIAIFLLIPIGG